MKYIVTNISSIELLTDMIQMDITMTGQTDRYIAYTFSLLIYIIMKFACFRF